MKLFAIYLVILTLFRKGISHYKETSTTCKETMPLLDGVAASACSFDYMIIIPTNNYAVGEAIHGKSEYRTMIQFEYDEIIFFA